MSAAKSFGETPVYAVASVQGKEYIVWSFLRGPKWFIGVTDVAGVWTASLDPAKRWKEDAPPGTSQTDHLAHFVASLRSEHMLFEPGKEGDDAAQLTVWRYKADGSQATVIYELKVVSSVESQTRLVRGALVGLTRAARTAENAESELTRLRDELSRAGEELQRLRQRESKESASGPVDWALGGMARRTKPKRDRHGAERSPKKEGGRDLVNPSMPERKKKKAIKYKGI